MPSNTKADFGSWGGKGTGGGGGSGGGMKSPGGQKLTGGGGGGAKVEYFPLFVRPDIRSKLQQLGMSEAGINALVAGAVITDPIDKAIVAGIVAAALA